MKTGSRVHTPLQNKCNDASYSLGTTSPRSFRDFYKRELGLAPLRPSPSRFGEGTATSPSLCSHLLMASVYPRVDRGREVQSLKLNDEVLAAHRWVRWGLQLGELRFPLPWCRHQTHFLWGLGRICGDLNRLPCWKGFNSWH